MTDQPLPKPYPKNAPGDFYVEDGCCMSCGVPHGTAPGLFAWDDKGAYESHCYVSRQPGNAEETEQMLDAVESSEADCIRYCGKDAAIIRRLVEGDMRHVLDGKAPPHLKPLVRTHVAFRLGSGTSHDTASSLARSLRKHLKAARGDYAEGVYRNAGGLAETVASFEYAWNMQLSSYVPSYYPITIACQRESRFLLHHSPVLLPGSRWVSGVIQKWLQANSSITDVIWYTAEEWDAGDEGQNTPY